MASTDAPRPPAPQTADPRHVLVGLSGGVDSAVSALLLQRAGYKVTGLLLRIPHAVSPEGDARQVADRLGIPLLVRDPGEEFERTVVADFVAEYAAGRTPNPCVRCNPAVKFPALLRAADEVGAQWIATGHYAGLRRAGEVVQLLRDDAAGRDQSYMLYRLTQPTLGRLLLPLTGMDKAAVRAIARSAGLPVAHKKDSQDICFVPDGDHAAFLLRRGAPMQEGDFIDAAGRVLGRHQGIGRYTVGQRKGLGVSADARLYVTGISAADNTVTLGSERELLRSSLTVKDLHFPAGAFSVEGLSVGEPPAEGSPADGFLASGFSVDGFPLAPFYATVKLRLGPAEYPATLTPLPGQRLRIDFDRPVRAPAPGQSAVFYSGEQLLGGGIVEEAPGE